MIRKRRKQYDNIPLEIIFLIKYIKISNHYFLSFSCSTPQVLNAICIKKNCIHNIFYII